MTMHELPRGFTAKNDRKIERANACEKMVGELI